MLGRAIVGGTEGNKLLLGKAEGTLEGLELGFVVVGTMVGLVLGQC